MKDTFRVDSLNHPISEWSEKELHRFRKWLISMMKIAPVTVTFKKKDGSERTMNCTLEPDKLPPREVKENTKSKKENLDIVSVYDIDANGWRSFILKNIINIKLVL